MAKNRTVAACMQCLGKAGAADQPPPSDPDEILVHYDAEAPSSRSESSTTSTSAGVGANESSRITGVVDAASQASCATRLRCSSPAVS